MWKGCSLQQPLELLTPPSWEAPQGLHAQRLLHLTDRVWVGGQFQLQNCANLAQCPDLSTGFHQ